MIGSFALIFPLHLKSRETPTNYILLGLFVSVGPVSLIFVTVLFFSETVSQKGIGGKRKCYYHKVIGTDTSWNRPPTKLRVGNVSLVSIWWQGVPMWPLTMLHWTLLYSPHPQTSDHRTWDPTPHHKWLLVATTGDLFKLVNLRTHHPTHWYWPKLVRLESGRYAS